LGISPAGMTQVADFTIPDTVCEDNPVVISNVQPVNATSYQWNFCTGNASGVPDGVNIGNPNQDLNAPGFLTMVRDSVEFYTFITSIGNARVERCYFGGDITQYPISSVNLGDFGHLTAAVRGIQVAKDNGSWYGLVANGDRLVHLDFGSSPGNTPTARPVILTGVAGACGLTLLKPAGTWVGFMTDEINNNLYRLDFPTGLAGDPVAVLLGNLGGLSNPAGIAVDSELGQWYAFICNWGNSTITRIRFGTSLLNPAPTGQALATVSWLHTNKGITLVHDCGTVTGLVTNYYRESDFSTVQLSFPKGMAGPVVGDLVSTQGMLNYPYGITEFIRQGDILYGFVANNGSSSVVRMFFPSCSGASLPFYNGPNPPPIIYADPGNYNIMLTVDYGLPSQASRCRNVVVLKKPDISLGSDRNICPGDTVLLDAGQGQLSYLWSTGDTDPSIRVNQSGDYWVHIETTVGCTLADTVRVTRHDTASSSIDTTLCNGLSFWAQHAARTTSGTYYDTLQTSEGCDSVVTTYLHFKECNVLIWLPTAFTPDGDGLNDLFRATGHEVGRFDMQIYDRWGRIVFETDRITTGWDGTLNGKLADPGVYTYLVHYENKLVPGEVHRQTGSFTLVR
ncbi:MAG TPA: gliding motility-associated C-terminal domain-containing protein, partial [Bacteroidales bacterium]|nr:gliding motility-associated C-terminal domain-containing protein [Bacteroidales bacterium]